MKVKVIQPGIKNDSLCRLSSYQVREKLVHKCLYTKFLFVCLLLLFYEITQIGFSPLIRQDKTSMRFTRPTADQFSSKSITNFMRWRVQKILLSCIIVTLYRLGHIDLYHNGQFSSIYSYRSTTVIAGHLDKEWHSSGVYYGWKAFIMIMQKKNPRKYRQHYSCSFIK